MVCSLTLCFLAASATEVRSHSRRIATICSSVNRLLRIGSSLAKEPFFQKLTDRKTSSGHLRIGSSLAKEPFFQKLTDRKTSSGHQSLVISRTSSSVSNRYAL